jgi:uncharacterized protein YndB with AHSA1/START domain
MTKLSLTTRDDTEVIVTRSFAVPPALVWRAHTEPALLQKWLLGPEGWTMPVCICEPVPGGRMRYEWTDGTHGFHLTGEFVTVEPITRIVHIERMHLPDPTPDNRVETLFQPQGSGTRMVMTMRLPDSATRAAMLATGMETGMEDSYARLEAMAADWR